MALALLKRAHVHLPPEILERAERIADRLQVSKCKVIRDACIIGLSSKEAKKCARRGRRTLKVMK